MTQMEHFLCLLWGCLIGHFIVYGWCRFWDFVTRKRVEIPDIKYDVTDNPILTLKSRLGQAYVATYDRTAKKLLHRLLEYVEWIDNWHKEQVLIVENDRNGYKRKAERLQAEFESECLKNAELVQQLKDAELKSEQLRQILKLNIGKPLFTPQDWQNTYGKEPIPAETVKVEGTLKQSIPMNTGSIIHIDSEDLNRYSTGRGPDGRILPSDIANDSKEELAEKLRAFWGLNADKKYVSADGLKRHYAGRLIMERHMNEPLRHFKVRVCGTYNGGKDSVLTDWTLPATSINQIRFMLGEDGLQVLEYEELP